MDIKYSVDDNGIAYTFLNGVKGTLNQMDVEILKYNMSKLEPNSVYVEIGSYLGCSGILAGHVMKGNALIYCHDIWFSNMEELSLESGPPPKTDDYFYKFYKNVKDNNLEHNIIPIRGDSSYTICIHGNESIDLAFIDGDHSYEGVLKDLEMIYPKMKPNSIILCHDATLGSSVDKAILEFAKSKNITDLRVHNPSSIISIVLK